MFAPITVRALNRRPPAARVLFKPVQRQIIEKLGRGQEQALSDNEKRYLRGMLGQKLTAIEQLLLTTGNSRDLRHPLLDTLDSYYLTGFEALKHNGFGWFYEPKVIIVVNTRLKGSVLYDGKQYRFVRVRSMESRQWYLDETNGLRYATNAQLIRDARELKDKTLERTWHSMLERYGNLFTGENTKLDGRKLELPLPTAPVPDKPEDYGV